MLGPIRTNLSKDEAKSSSICDDIRKSISDIISRRSKAMTSLSQVECSLKHIFEERADVLAREMGCIKRQRKFSGADLLQTLVFGWLGHPDASLEALASVATLREVEVTDTAVHKRFTQGGAQFLHAILEEMTGGVGEAGREVPLGVAGRFGAAGR